MLIVTTIELFPTSKVWRKSPMHCFNRGSIDWTWSEIVNLAAVTIVVLMSAEGLLSAALNRGNNPSGSVSVSFPKHSATTLRVPSSLHSQWRKRRSQIWGTNGRNCAMASVPRDNEVITSFNEWSSKYWRRDWASIWVRMKGKNAGRFPTATEPRAWDAADFTWEITMWFSFS